MYWCINIPHINNLYPTETYLVKLHRLDCLEMFMAVTEINSHKSTAEKIFSQTREFVKHKFYVLY